MGRRPKTIDQTQSAAGLFGGRMRALRLERGWSPDELGRELNCSAEHASKIELGSRAPDEHAATTLDRIYGTGTFFQDVLPLVLKERLPEATRSLAEHEGWATIIRIFEPTLIAGLFQNEQYIRALALADSTPHLVDEIVEVRLGRQAVLEREHPPRVLLVVDEAALRRTIGGPQVMKAQLTRLLEDMRRPHITVQVIPARTTAHVGLSGAFALLSFDEGPDAAYVTGPGGTGRMIDEPAALTRLEETYDLIRSVVLPVEDTERLIREIRDAL
jgi:transcriptional regulator with XRE-family HTH domain